MRIAQVAPVYESVPPQGYGGTERVVSYLTETLVELGHEVTLFASGDSVTTADLVPIAERSLRSEPEFVCAAWHMLMLEHLFERASDFDIIHFHLDFLHYPLARHCPTPSVTTLHGRLDMPHVQALHRRFSEHPLVSISDDQRRAMPDANFVATVHHGLPLGLYRFTPQPQDYFAFVGRVSPEKRLDRAIEIATACNTRLVVAAKVDNRDRAYFEREIQPLLSNPLVSFVGEMGDEGKNRLLGGARALLFPIDWPEPFGLVVIESLACGTPVLAYRHGSVPELLDDGVTGFLVDDQEAAIAAARRIGELDRRRCRQVFEERFAATAMAQRYLAVYASLIRSRQQAPAELASAAAK